MAKGEETNAMLEGKGDPLPVGWFALLTPSDAMPKDRGLYVKRRGLVMLAGLVVTAICWGLGQSAEFVENVYARGFGQSIGRGLATVTGWLPTSLAEVVVVAVVLYWVALWLRACWFVLRRKRRALNAVACGGLSLGAFILSAVALFYVVWGINYFRAPLVERAGWQEHTLVAESREGQTRELEQLCESLVTATNDEYFATFGTEDLGAPSAPLAEWSAIDLDLEQAYERMQDDLGLEASFGAPRARAKPVAASAVMNYLHIGGFYFPWTGEANYNRLQPACVLPHVIAHEKAHQRCVTSEDEANFLGFAACVRGDDPYVRYSGYLFAQRQLLGELFQLDRQRATELVKKRHPGVQRDVDHMREYWKRLESGVAGTVGDVSTAVNDAYLKTNQVEGGVMSYRMSSKLLIVYYRKWKP